MNQSNSPRRSSYQGPRSKRLAEQRRRKKRMMILGGAGAAAAVLVIGAVIFWPGKDKEKTEAVVTETESTEAPLHEAVTVDGISLEGMSREEAKKALMEKHPWNLQVAREGEEGKETLTISNMVEPAIDELLDEIFASEEGGDYTLEITRVEERIEADVAAVAKAWDVKAKNTRLDHFDNNTGKFVFTDGKAGKVVDQEKLTADIEAVIASGDYKQTIDVAFLEVAPEDPEKVKGQYKTLATFTTKTTNNAKRNTNVRLAAEALNGTIVQPG